MLVDTVNFIAALLVALSLFVLYRRCRERLSQELSHRYDCEAASNLEKGDNISIESSDKHKIGKLPAFKASRLTQSTFLITEWDDVFSEHPFIYAKLVHSANTILILDTGCGGATKNSDIGIKSLRKFIETVAVEDNGGKPLNEGGRMGYVVVQSHCHYDHILGVEQFAEDSDILASSHSPSFISPENLPVHSHCKALGICTPSYTPTLVPHLWHIVSGKQESGNGIPLGVTVLHTPGHCPDELALWDENERMLYVGDTLYEHDNIIFPNEGSIVTWFSTIDYLISFVCSREIDSPSLSEAKINCGHATALRPALDVLEATKSFIMDVVSGKEALKSRRDRGGIVQVEYRQEGGRFALVCPERLVLEARDHFKGMESADF